MTYNYGKQIRVCSKVSYILKKNNDARDLSPSLRIEKNNRFLHSLTWGCGACSQVHKGQCLHKKKCKCLWPRLHNARVK